MTTITQQLIAAGVANGEIGYAPSAQIRILERALELTNEIGWTQHAMGRDDEGTPIDCVQHLQDAKCLCAVGYIYRARLDLNLPRMYADKASDVLGRAIIAGGFAGDFVAEWNDAPNQTPVGVRYGLRRAITYAKDLVK